MIKIAIIGAGYIGSVHANACSKVKDAKIVAVMDRNLEIAKKLGDKFSANSFDNLDILLSEDIDIVAICTPTFLHAEMVEKTAKAKKNIFCEKPLAINIEETDLMIKAIKKSNIKSMVGHVLRFWPEYVLAKDIVKSGIVGEPLHISCERL